MKETANAVSTIWVGALVLGSIGASLGIVQGGDWFNRDYKTYNTISGDVEGKNKINPRKPMRFLDGGYSIANPSSVQQKFYNEMVNSLFRSDIPDDQVYMLLDTMKEQILLGDDSYESFMRDFIKEIQAAGS